MYIYIYFTVKTEYINELYYIIFHKMKKNIFNSFFTKIFVSKVSNKNFGEKTIKYIIFHQDKK